MKKTIISAKTRADGNIAEILEGGVERPFPEAPTRPMTESEISAAAEADPEGVRRSLATSPG